MLFRSSLGGTSCTIPYILIHDIASTKIRYLERCTSTVYGCRIQRRAIYGCLVVGTAEQVEAEHSEVAQLVLCTSIPIVGPRHLGELECVSALPFLHQSVGNGICDVHKLQITTHKFMQASGQVAADSPPQSCLLARWKFP